MTNNKELIERIDKAIDEDNWGRYGEVLQDCKAALSSPEVPNKLWRKYSDEKPRVNERLYVKSNNLQGEPSDLIASIPTAEAPLCQHDTGKVICGKGVGCAKCGDILEQPDNAGLVAELAKLQNISSYLIGLSELHHTGRKMLQSVLILKAALSAKNQGEVK